VDILRLPLVGAVLRWPHIRKALQALLLVVAAAVVCHGLFGPQIGPRNLSTVLTSIHWRGLLVVVLLLAGNLFCTACPMILVRDAGRRLVRARLTWPRALRRKWLGLTLLGLVLFGYELFEIWDRPAATAGIVLGYFALALLIDLTFKGATFCKHVCPIGQFNFIASTVAPTEIVPRDAETCRSCRTYDCIKGQRSRTEPLRVVRRGCELGLFVPAKAGNLDCTLCFDCVQACPHDNVALVTRLPGAELLALRRRSGIGRLAERPDIAALAVLFTFGALVNAFAMTAPAFTLEQRLASMFGLTSEAAILALIFVGVLLVLPVALLGGAAAVTRGMTGSHPAGYGTTAARFAFALVPLGLGVWLSHYGFHFLTGVLTIVPVAQSAVIDLVGAPAWGEPAWRWIGMSPGSAYPIQLGFTLLGAFGSAALAYAISARDYPQRAAAASVPWLMVVGLLTVAAVWLVGQPMEMRGLGGIG
jgi:polyferredoxin